jgi:hypothetical protein
VFPHLVEGGFGECVFHLHPPVSCFVEQCCDPESVHIAVNDCKYVAVVDLFRRATGGIICTVEENDREEMVSERSVDGSNTDAYGLKPGTAADWTTCIARSAVPAHPSSPQLTLRSCLPEVFDDASCVPHVVHFRMVVVLHRRQVL